MIRYLTKDDVYYSLNDVTNWLYQQDILTNDQREQFNFKCRAYMAATLDNAYKEQRVFNHVEPVILPIQDYFIHWIIWANLLMLLPEDAGKHPYVHRLNLLLDNPETVYIFSEVKPGIKLVCLDDQLKLAAL
ncbi:hypothetical protein [Spirosoma aerophilum]